MKIQDPNDPDKEIEVFTPEEVEAQKTAAIAEKDAAIAEKDAKLAEAEKWRAEQTSNFKKLKDMTETEKASMSAKEIEHLKRIEAAEARAQAAEEMINNDKKTKTDAAKEAIITKYAGKDEALRATFTANFDVVGIDDLEKRGEAAARMSGIAVGGPNPLHQPFYGAAPSQAVKTEKEEFLKSDKAIAAEKAMGVYKEPEQK